MLYRFLVLPLAACVLLVLMSCGGGSSSNGDNNSPPPLAPPPTPAGYLTVTGTLTAPTGVLPEAMTVVSLGREFSVDGLGAYSAEVHSDGVSLMIAMQGNRPFALARIVVADPGLSADAVSIDTTSTAVSLVFVSPFIMTQEPVEAASLLALVENDVAIPALAQAIDDAFNDADPFQNADFRGALKNALDSIVNRLTPVAAAPNGSQKANSASNTSLVRLPKRSGVQLLAAQQAEATPIPIDTEHTDINVVSSGDQYFLQPTSSILNSVDWFVEVGEIDVSGFQYTHQWEPLLADPYTVYPRVGPGDEPVGIDINSAQGFYRWLEFVSMGLNWLVDQIQNRISPDGISVSQVNDGLYIVRSFSSGTAGGATEHDFVQNEVPNGALNHRRARIINHLSAAMDILGIAIDLLPAIDDTIANDCLKGSLIDLYTDTSVSIEITNSVVSEVLTVTDITQDLIIDFSVCVIGRAGITSVTGLGWLNDVWDVLTGLAGVPVTGAQLAERFTFMFVRATPLESMLIQVGSPIVDDIEPPTIPATFTATPISTTEIQLQWSESSDNDAVAEYVLYRDNAIIGSTSTLSFQDNGLTASTTYCYEIEAFDFVGNPSGRSSPPVCETTLSVPDMEDPTIPQNVVATAVSDTSIDVSWSPSSDNIGVTEYVVFRDDQPIQTVSSNSYSDTGLTAGVQYCYTVVAYDAAGNESPQSTAACATTLSDADTLPPTVPSIVTATAISDNQVNVSWIASTDNIAVIEYKIYRDNVLLAAISSTFLTDGAAQAATTYCYEVTAIDAAGNESARSTPVACATTLVLPDTTPPSIPTGLSATVDSASQISLAWNPSTDNVALDAYNVYRDGVLQGGVVETGFIDQGLTSSTTFCYTVSALDTANNESDRSPEKCATTSDSTSRFFRGIGQTSRPEDVSADGLVVVGSTGISGRQTAFRWTAETGMELIPSHVAGNGSVAYAVSVDGTVLVGDSSNEAMRWTTETGIVPLGGLSSHFSSDAFDVSGDGSVVVGQSLQLDEAGSIIGSSAFRWTAEMGMVALGDISTITIGSGASGVSADGAAVVGVGCANCQTTSPHGFYWRAETNIFTPIVRPNEIGELSVIPVDVSADGTTVVGQSTGSFDNPAPVEAIRWTVDLGAVGLGDLSGGTFRSTAASVSGDGSIIVGYSNHSDVRPFSTCFIWDEVNGMRAMRDFLSEEMAIDLTGWTVGNTCSISDDGHTIVGAGVNPEGQTEGWIAFLGVQ